MSDLADAVLPLIRTRADLHRWSASNEHGWQMQQAVTTLEQAAATENPAVVFVVTQKAIASALKVIMRADDSSGIIGDACRSLLDLHPKIAAAAMPPTGKLVDWMMAFQFDNECDFFTLDPVVLRRALLASQYTEIEMTARHALATVGLPSLHKDPFDRLLIAQAIVEGITLLTADTTILRYPGPIQRV